MDYGRWTAEPPNRRRLRSTVWNLREAGVKAIRVLQRAAEVLRSLERRPGSALAELHADTGMPKPTLLRILATLEGERMVRRAMADGSYHSRVSFLRPARADQKLLDLADAAAPHLVALRRNVVWPSDIGVRRGYYMRLIESSRRVSSLAMHRDGVGFRIDMAVSAVGRAYLAFCPEAERIRLVEHMRAHPARYPGSAAIDDARMKRVITETRARGYAVRDSAFGGLGWLADEEDDKLAAIAVPVMSGTAVLACLNLVWPRRLQTEAQVARRYLGELQRTAAAIAADAAGAAAPARRVSQPPA